MQSPNAAFWKEVLNSEIESILANHVWELVDLPPGTKPLGHKRIFQKKLRTDGSIEKLKARLVAKGFKQREGADFFDTYAPVTRITNYSSVIGCLMYIVNCTRPDIAYIVSKLSRYMSNPSDKH